MRSASYEGAVDIHMLAQEFLRYKTTGSLPRILGKDVPYDRPKAVTFVELQHIHTDLEKTEWSANTRARFRTSDSAIVYCRGENDPDNYLLIAYLENNAHMRANKITFMLELAEIAEKFRQKF